MRRTRFVRDGYLHACSGDLSICWKIGLDHSGLSVYLPGNTLDFYLEESIIDDILYVLNAYRDERNKLGSDDDLQH